MSQSDQQTAAHLLNATSRLCPVAPLPTPLTASFSPNALPSGAGGPAALSLPIACGEPTADRLVTFLTSLRDTDLAYTHYPSSRSDSPPPETQLCEPVDVESKEFQCCAEALALFDSNELALDHASVLFVRTPADCINSVSWAILLGRLHSLPDATSRLCEMARFLSGQHWQYLWFHCSEVCEEMVFKTKVTRWNVHELCAQTQVLGLDPEILLGEQGPHTRSAHVLAACLKYRGEE